jgi:hypothetical protein
MGQATADLDPADVEAVPSAPQPAREFAAWFVRYRVRIVAAYAVLSAAVAIGTGIPDRPFLILWLVGALWHSPNRAAQFVIDWLPVLVIAAGYDLVRSFSSDLLPRATTKPQLRFDEILFGGTAPTVILQRWLHPGVIPHWWDYLVFCFYLSHFVVAPTFAVFLYVRDRARFKRFAWMILTVSLLGFATYFIMPAVPPWLASRHGDLQHTVRVVQRVWANLGAGGPSRAFNGSTRFANPVAALPSAWPFLIILSVWKTAPRGRWIAVAYMAAMVFVLVYGAEHYVSDILMGWLYATIVFFTVSRILDDRAITARATASA